MIKLLVIADDITGALDTGVQFKTSGTQIRVAASENEAVLVGLREQIQILIVDAETRHMEAEKAKQVISRIVFEAVEAGIPCIYKKTDSGLRGNIGSELAAMLQASGQERLHFIPAFPKMGRKTVEGIHYIDGIPVADSIFGTDPFEPVRQSSVQKIIASQSDVATCPVAAHTAQREAVGVLIYDAGSDEDLNCIAANLKKEGQLHLLAGCAGFAAVLPRLLELEQDAGILPALRPGLVTICGSINPITVRQLDAAERAGIPRISLTPRQKLEPDWLSGEDGDRHLKQWLSIAERTGGLMVECGVADGAETKRYAVQRGLSQETIRLRISSAMGGILKGMLDRGLASTLLVTGGDTLLAFLQQIGRRELEPMGELMPGVVLSQFEYQGRTCSLISKSGGFGGETLITDLEQLIAHHSEEELVC